jgi:hypothetical protein
MELITDNENIMNSNSSLMCLSQSVFHIVTKNQKSKTVDFFKDIYTYPPRFKIKWDSIDKLYGDLMLSYNYNLLDNNFPFVNIVKVFFNSNLRTSNVSDVEYFQNKLELIKTTTKRLITYSSDNYSNKNASINFYSSNTKQIQQSIQNIPIYTIVQGQQGEIVVASSRDTKGILDPLKTTAYNFYGGFGNAGTESNKLGLFFMSRNDAEVYLKELVTRDVIGTNTFGLSIECVSLDFAYRVTREYHPGIDFRFIPNLEEVKNLLNKDAGAENSNLIFEDDQQQLRFRKRVVTIESLFGVLSHWLNRLTLLPSFSYRNESFKFKGVPIFVVQSSIEDESQTGKVRNYIFFDKIGAIKFCNSHGRKVSRYDGDTTWHLDSIRKPKIFVHNLEDFLELWEDALLRNAYKDQSIGDKNSKLVSIFDTEATYFVPPEETIIDLNEYKSKHNRPSLSRIKLFFEFKFRCFNGWTEKFLNAN